MNKIFLVLISVILILIINIVSASDVLVWQGQYYTGTTFNTGTYEFNFSVYDALTGGNTCYSNITNLTTGNWGEWKIEQEGVGSACNNISKDYYLNINIDGTDQTPRRRLVVWNYLRKDTDEISTGSLVLHGTLQGLSPLKLQDEINFIKSDGTITSALYNAPRELASTLPSSFADSLIHDIISETNDYGMQECFWDENTETMQMCISGAYLSGRATTVSRSFQIVGNATNKLVNENFTLCEGNNYVDCDTDATGADLLVEDDIESRGSIFSQENITADDTGFFNYLGSSINRITKLFVQDIDASGNVNASNYTLNGTTIHDWNDISSVSELTPVYLENNLNATNAEYTTIFTIALTPSKMNIVKVYLAQSSSTAGVAVQNRVIINDAGPVGNCNFMTQAGDTVENIDNIAVSTNSANTGESAMSLDVNVPFINTIICTILADANQKNLIVQFESETAVANITTYTGSYYTNTVN
ncbi:MAG: hypothetical protein WC812_01135 [Candidatus Pacearchaeota archaeon]|jgi:hypothetical protein